MSHRIGECSSCGAVYKLPASFAHDQARCKKCGGVVQIGPAQFPEAHQAEPEPEPAAPPVPTRKAPAKPAAKATPAPASTPAPAARKKERGGPSMKEQILARQRETAEGRPPATSSGARVGAAAAGRPAGTAGTMRPAIKAAGLGAGSAATGSGPGRPRTTGRGAETAAAGTTGSRRAAPARSRRGARGAAVEEEDEDSGAGRRGRRQAPPKKNASLLPGLVAVVLLLALGGAAWFFMSSDETNAGEPSPAEVAGGAAAGEGAALDATGGGDAADGGAEDAAPLEDVTTGAEDPPAAVDDEPAEDEAAKPAPSEKPKGDPDSIDLSAIEDFGPPEGTGEETWAEIQQLAADVVDPMAGAAGNRAKLELEKIGKPAVPALINRLKKLDLTTDEDFRSADVVTKTLQFILNGNNYGWLYKHQETWLFYDKKAIKSWADMWRRAKDDEAYWLKVSKQDQKAGEEPAEKQDEPLIKEDEFDFEDDF